MTRINRIQTFLTDYKHLNPTMKELLNEVHQDYQALLMNEYVKVSKHPFPAEYSSI